MRCLIIAMLAALVASCNTQKFVKRQLARHPEWATDSTILVQWDTVHTASYLHDTTVVWRLTDSTDTLTLDNDTVRITITRWRDRVKVVTVVKPQKVPYRKTTTITRRVTVAEKRHWIKALWQEGWQLFTLLAGTIVAAAIIRNKK
jgi:hypothetical protein